MSIIEDLSEGLGERIGDGGTDEDDCFLTVEQLIAELKKYPASAKVYVWADHGQVNCWGYYVTPSNSPSTRMTQAFDFDEEIQFAEDVPPKQATAVCISGCY